MIGTLTLSLWGQTTTQIQDKQTLVSYDQQGRRYYKTLDGNIRYFHNPNQSDKPLSPDQGYDVLNYAVGATQSPYKNIDDIKSQTKQPLDLCDTDFFSNFINAKQQTSTFIRGRTTGNPCYNYKEYEDIKGVSYENEKHWNIQRFAINPHFGGYFKLPIDTARINVTYDLYRYFLYQNRDKENSRNMSWGQTLALMVYIDSIVNGKTQVWLKENINELNDQNGKWNKKYYYEPPLGFYTDEGYPSFLYTVLDHNSNISGTTRNKKLFTKKEIIDLLINYNIEYRRKSLDEAKKIVMKNIEDVENNYKDQLKKCSEEKDAYTFKNPPEGMVDPAALQMFYTDERNILTKKKIKPTEDEIKKCEQLIRSYSLK